MRTDLNSNVDVVQSINPATYNSAQTGAVVDLAGYGEAEVILVVGTKTDGTHTPTVQEGDAANGSDAANVAAADLVGTALVALTSNTVQRIGYLGKKRYIRVITTGSGATGCVYGAIVVRSGARKQALA